MNLWAKIAGGDDDAVSLFCTCYQARFQFMCCKRGIPYDDCPDVVQETIAAAVAQLRSAKGFRGESNFDSWLLRILSNKIADYWRKRSRQVPCVPMGAGESEDDPQLEVALVQADPELPIILDEALATLPDELRLLLLLNAMDGYTAREIAPMVRRSEGRVGTLIAEAKRLLRIAIRQPEREIKRKRLNIGE